MKPIILLLAFLLSQNLAAHEEFVQSVVNHGHYLKKMSVKSFGDLRLIRDNKLTQSFPYSSIRANDLYGIGMPKGLDSELMITSGDLYEGKFDDRVYSTGRVKKDRDIAFLAYANVKSWQTVPVPDGITTFSQLEEALPGIAQKAGINTSVPFPFLLRSKVEGLKWFIVNGMGNGKPDYLSSFLRSRYIGGLDDAEIEGMGFYSDKHRGVISAPNSSMHIHFRTLNKPLFVGHIDNVMILAKGAELLFPVDK